MPRPLEKTHQIAPEVLRDMIDAYRSPVCLGNALGTHDIEARRILRGEGLRPNDYERLMERWKIVDPRVLQGIVRLLHDQVRDDRAAVAELGFVEIEELRAFLNAIFPHLKVK